MSVDSAVPLAPAGEELVVITSGGKTYLVPKALADEVLRRRRLKAARLARSSAAKGTTVRKRKRRRRRSTGGSTRSRAARTGHFRPGRGRVRLIA
jgi:hypothetical protein